MTQNDLAFLGVPTGKMLLEQLADAWDASVGQVVELREALGCAIEELERRHPLDADPLTVAIIRDGRVVLSAAGTEAPTKTRCMARRVHPYSSDFSIRCERNAGHQGEHGLNGCRWDNDSKYVLAAAGTEAEQEQDLGVASGDVVAESDRSVG